MKRLAILGTDTGVGKTTVGCALAAAYSARGFRVATLKPVETGCRNSDEGLVPDDALRLATAAGEALPPRRSLAAVCPNRFALPASPEAAATAEGRRVDVPAIHQAIAARADADLLLVEGAGGLLVPLAPGLLQADLIRQLAIPVLIVARAALGTVNHTLMTIEAARNRGIPLAGVLLNRSGDPPGPDDVTNGDAIATYGGVVVLGTLARTEPEPSALARAIAACVDLEALWRSI